MSLSGSPYLLSTKTSSAFLSFLLVLTTNNGSDPVLPYQLPHQNDVQKLSGFGIIKTEVQSSLTNSDLRPDNSLF